MADPNTLRVLSIDGGGARGYFSLLYLKDWVISIGESPDDKTVFKRRFNVVGGTSAGNLIVLLLVSGIMSLNEVIDFFDEHVPYIFSLSSIIPSFRPNREFKLVLLAADIPFYQSSGPSENSYGAGLLKTLVQDIFGSMKMSDLETNVIVPGYQLDTKTYVTFSNLETNGFIGQNFLISDIAMAASAAPAYFPPWTFGGHTYIDSGVYQNNPSFFAYVYGRTLFPSFRRTCLMSLGTGQGEYGFDPSGNPGPPSFLSNIFHPSGVTEEEFKSTPVYQKLLQKNPSLSSLKSVSSILSFNTLETLFSLFEICSTGGQESIHKCFEVLAASTLEPFYYHRANSVLDVENNTELDNASSDIRNYYRDFEGALFESDIDRIVNFNGHFLA